MASTGKRSVYWCHSGCGKKVKSTGILLNEIANKDIFKKKHILICEKCNKLYLKGDLNDILKGDCKKTNRQSTITPIENVITTPKNIIDKHMTIRGY